MSEPIKDEKNESCRTCPQCDGAGQETFGSCPKLCRKCKGAGTTANVVKSAAVLDGGALEEGDSGATLDDDFADEQDSDIPRDQVSNNNNDDMCGFIASLVRSMNEGQLVELFGKTKHVVGDETAAVIDDKGEPDAYLAIRYIVGTACKLAKEGNDGNAESSNRLMSIYRLVRNM